MRPETAMDAAVDQYQREWTSLCARRHNLLLEGSAVATHAALLLLRPHLRQPVAWSELDAPLQLPNGDAGALVLRDVAAVSTSDQARLLAWTSGGHARTQIVSTTEGPLFALVVRGLFDATLYYRLNIVLLRIESTAPTSLLDVPAEHSVAVP